MKKKIMRRPRKIESCALPRTIKKTNILETLDGKRVVASYLIIIIII